MTTNARTARCAAALVGVVGMLALAGCAGDGSGAPGSDTCVTDIDLITPDGATVTLTSANIQSLYGGQVVTVFASDVAIDDHDVPGRPPTFPSEEGTMLWLDVGDPRPDSEVPFPESGQTVDVADTATMPVTTSIVTATRIDPLFGEQSGAVELGDLDGDDACIAIDATIAGAQISGTAAGPILRGE